MVKLYFSDEATAMNLDVRVKAIAKEGDISIFPESGLHPSKHMDITEALHVKYKEGDVYVATHGELVIMRALRMIREGRASIDDFELWQVCTSDKGDEYERKIDVDAEGDILTNVKDGFFEIAYREQFGL